MAVETDFLDGQKLSRAFWEDVVSPVVSNAFPGLSYAAGLLGPGSDVLGYDTERSMDHDWGPRCTLILSEEDERSIGPALRDTLTHLSPTMFRGYPVLFQDAVDDPGVAVPALPSSGASTFHRVSIFSLPSFLANIGLEPRPKLDAAFWLTVTEQQLLECTSGAVFRDDLGELTSAREVLSYYPDDVWRYRMAAMWMRISKIQPFVGRTGEVGDEVGSFMIGARLAEDVMRLALLQAQQYAPYTKWLGTAFSRLENARALSPRLDDVRRARTWPERERALAEATSLLVEEHNELGITSLLDSTPRAFHSRPFMVIDRERVCDAIMATLGDSPLGRLPRVIGGIDQFMDSTDALKSDWLRNAIRAAMRETMLHVRSTPD